MSDYEDSFEQSTTDSDDGSLSDSEAVPTVPTAKPTVASPSDTGGYGSSRSPRAKAAIDSGEWCVQKDPTTGRPYYYHVKTHHTTWDLDEELGSSESDANSSEDESVKEKSGDIQEKTGSSTSQSHKDHSSSTEQTNADHSSISRQSDNSGSMNRTEEHPAPAMMRRRTALVPPAIDPSNNSVADNQVSAIESSAGSGSLTAASDPIASEFNELSKFVAFKGSLSSTASPNRQASAATSGSLNPEKVPFPLPVPVPVVANSASVKSRSESKLKAATSTSTDNDEGLSAALLERKKLAAQASQLDEYQNLEQFVAFGDHSAATSSSRVRNETSTDSPTHTDMTRHSVEKEHDTSANKLDSVPIRDASVKEKKSSPESERGQYQSDSAVASVITPTSVKEVQNDKTPDNTDASSIFSTLSQHLTAAVKLPSSTFSSPSETTVPLAPQNPTMDGPPPLSTAKALDETEKSATPHVPPQLTPPNVSTGSPTTTTTASPVSITLQMPPLPTVSSLSPIPPLSTVLDPPKQSGAVESTTKTNQGDAVASPSSVESASKERAGLFTSSLPLPPPMGASMLSSMAGTPSLPLTAQQKEEQRALLQHEQRIDELRETSLAVERLVHAFAALRGHAPSSPEEIQKLSHRTVEDRSSTTMHRVGASSTMKIATERPPVPPSPLHTIHRFSTIPSVSNANNTTSTTQEDEKVAKDANQKILEDVIRECIVSLMTDRKGQQATTAHRGRSVSSAIPPFSNRADLRGMGVKHHISVSTEDFAYGAAAQRRGGRALSSEGPSTKTRRTHLSVFDGEMSAFSPVGLGEDADADVALQSAIEQALERYLWSRVVRPPGGGPGTTQRNQLSSLAPFVTPYVAWVLLLDVMIACRQIIEWGFVRNGEGSSVDYPVLVRFDGPVAMDEIARATMHCLPFEALSGLASENGSSVLPDESGEQRKKSIFRLEYWVTRERLFSILDAVSMSLRQHIVLYASELHYAPFYNDTEAVCLPNGIVPPHSPFFSVLPPPSGPHATAVRRQKFRDGFTLCNQKPPRGWQARVRFMDEKEQGDDLDPAFGVGEEAVERLAHVVSSLATDILTKENAHLPQGMSASQSATDQREGLTGMTHLERPTDFPQLCTFVAETACELFQDVSVKAAIERRAAMKMKEYYSSRGTYKAGSRLDQEKQLIQKAEAQAESLVSRIMQELHAQKVKESRSLFSR